jgi:hypothetical protein
MDAIRPPWSDSSHAHIRAQLDLLLEWESRHGFERRENAVPQHAEIERRVCSFHPEVDRAV